MNRGASSWGIFQEADLDCGQQGGSWTCRAGRVLPVRGDGGQTPVGSLETGERRASGRPRWMGVSGMVRNDTMI